MAEVPLFQAIYGEVFYKYESLPVEKRVEYRSLVGWKGTSDFEVLAIFKTNRFVTIMFRLDHILQQKSFD
jgi:hypothetical protein